MGDWAIDVVPLGRVEGGALAWTQRGQTGVTIFVKATLSIEHGRPATLTETRPVARADHHFDKSPLRSVEVASDLAVYKPFCDVTLTGHAHAPPGRPAPATSARLAIFRGSDALLDKTLHVFGDRARGDAAPRPFQSMSLRYERALGSDDNPVGVAPKGAALPNLVDPRGALRRAGFGPIAQAWPERRELVGETRFDRTIAELGEDLAWAYFQAAPPDQRIGYLRGDEWLVLDGMHPALPRVVTQLPGIRAAARVASYGERASTRSVNLLADTLAIDADRMTVSLVWRARIPLPDPSVLEVLRAFVGVELGDARVEFPDASTLPAPARAVRPLSTVPPPDSEAGGRSQTLALAPEQVAALLVRPSTPFEAAEIEPPPPSSERGGGTLAFSTEQAAALLRAPASAPAPVAPATPFERPQATPVPPPSAPKAAPAVPWQEPAAPMVAAWEEQDQTLIRQGEGERDEVDVEESPTRVAPSPVQPAPAPPAASPIAQAPQYPSWQAEGPTETGLIPLAQQRASRPGTEPPPAALPFGNAPSAPRLDPPPPSMVGLPFKASEDAPPSSPAPSSVPDAPLDLEPPPRRSNAVPIVAPPGLALATMPWQVKPPQDSLTVLAKATFDLVPHGPATLREEPELPTGDVHWEDDETRSVRLGNDFAVFKPRVDVTVIGHAYAPGGSAPAAEVELRIGTIRRRISVFGDRHWKKAVLQTAMSDPAPFERIPLVHERAFGGATHLENPVGVGFRGAGGGALPNLEDPSHLLKSPSDTAPSVCFAPIPVGWPLRAARMGTYGGRYLATRWPYFPEDFDWAYFQVAPPGQQLDALSGDESFSIAGMHPLHPRLDGLLPGVRVRAFLDRTKATGGGFEEARLTLDTVAFDMDALTVSLTWRGLVPVSEEEAPELNAIFAAVERLDAPPMTLAAARGRYLAKVHARDVIEEGPDLATDAANDVAPDEIDEGAEKAEAAVDALLADLRAAGVPDEIANAPMPPPPAADPEAMLQHLRALGASDEEVAEMGEAMREAEAPARADTTPPPGDLRAFALFALASGDLMDGMDLEGADLRELNFRGRSLEGANLKGANLTGALLDEANFTDAQLSGATLDGARALAARFEGADLTGASLAKLDAKGALLSGADLTGVKGEGTDFTGATGEKTVFAEAELPGVKLDQANLAGADFTRANLERASLRGADLTSARLYDTRASGAIFDEAKLGGLRAEGAILTRASLRGCELSGAILESADLVEATFFGSKMAGASLARAKAERAIFTSCDLAEARLRRGKFKHALFLKADLRMAQLERADLRHADLRGANLHAAEVWRAELEGAKLDLAIVTQSKLAKGILTP